MAGADGRARRADPVPETTDDYGSGFSKALEELEDAFWTESLSVAPVETGEAVKSALIQIVSATDPHERYGTNPGLDGLIRGLWRHLDELVPSCRVARRTMATGVFNGRYRCWWLAETNAASPRLPTIRRGDCSSLDLPSDQMAN